MAARVGVTRTPHFRNLDRYFGGEPDELMARYDAALTALASDRSLAQLAGARVDAEASGHFSAHWLDHWWPAHQPVEPVLRRGIVEAITRARAARLPLQSFLVEGPHDRFEVAVVDGPRQVTMVIIAPLPDDATDREADDGIAVVRRRDGEVSVD
jgi:hypothetical protein